MIAIRLPNGKRTTIDAAVSIEVMDAQGRVAAIVTQDMHQNVLFLTPEDPRFHSYLRATKATAAPHVHVHPS